MADETKDPKQEEKETEQQEETTEEKAEETQEESKEEKQEESADDKKEDAPAEEVKEESSDDTEEGKDVEVPEKFRDIVEKIENMSVLDLNELVKLLEKKFGVSAAAVAAPAGGAAAEGGAEEKSEFDVELTSAGDKKIQVIKAVKGALGLGLKEAKDLVEGAPTMLKEGMPKEEAEELKGQVEEAGGSVELK